MAGCSPKDEAPAPVKDKPRPKCFYRNREIDGKPVACWTVSCLGDDDRLARAHAICTWIVGVEPSSADRPRVEVGIAVTLPGSAETRPRARG